MTYLFIGNHVYVILRMCYVLSNHLLRFFFSLALTFLESAIAKSVILFLATFTNLIFTYQNHPNQYLLQLSLCATKAIPSTICCSMSIHSYKHIYFWYLHFSMNAFWTDQLSTLYFIQHSRMNLKVYLSSMNCLGAS